MAVVGEARIERQPHEAGLAPRGDGERRDGLRVEAAILHDPDAADTLGDEEPPVGRERQRPGDLQATRDRLDARLGRGRGGERQQPGGEGA